MYRKSNVKNNISGRKKVTLKKIIKRYINSKTGTKRYGELYLTLDEIRDLQQRFKRGEWDGRRLNR